MNHAAADGIGSLRVLCSIARAYAGQADPVPDVDPLTPRDPAAAFFPGGGFGGPVRRGLALLRELHEAAGKWTRVAPEGGEDRPGYGFHRVALTAEQTAAFVGGHPAGVTVHDLLLAALHLTVEEWNAEHRVSAGRIGVMMPVNLRPRAWWHEVVGNARVQRLPLRLRRALASLLSRDPFVPTGVLSNLGRVDEPLSFGPEVGEVAEVWFSPPAKTPSGLAVGAGTAARCSGRRPRPGSPAATSASSWPCASTMKARWSR